MAAYQAKLSGVEAKGVRFIALSVDRPEIAEEFRHELGLDFTILCDTEREVVKAWDRFNRWEMGGIAKPALFVIDSDMRVRLASLDSASKRYSACGGYGLGPLQPLVDGVHREARGVRDRL